MQNAAGFKYKELVSNTIQHFKRFKWENESNTATCTHMDEFYELYGTTKKQVIKDCVQEDTINMKQEHTQEKPIFWGIHAYVLKV